MRQQKQQRETREIKGEVESHSMQITSFHGGRGSRGIKIEGEWHNIIGSKVFLEQLNKEHPPGSFVKFNEFKNNKGYWDAVEGSLRKITKQEAYNKDIPSAIEEKHEPAYVEDVIQVNDVIKSQAEKEQQEKIQKAEARIADAEIKDEKKYFEETGQAFFQIPREDAIKMFNDFMKDPTLKAINLPFRPQDNPVMQIKATLIVTVISGLGPKIILEVDKSHPEAVRQILLLLLGELQIAGELVKEKIMQHKRNIIMEKG